MRTVITAVAAALLATALAIPADAAGTKKKGETAMNSANSTKAATCKAEAKKKFSMLHPLKRRAYEKKCMGTA